MRKKNAEKRKRTQNREGISESEPNTRLRRGRQARPTLRKAKVEGNKRDSKRCGNEEGRTSSSFFLKGDDE
jgi:hypothetical protein